MRLIPSRNKAVVLSKRAGTLYERPDMTPDPVGRVAQGYFDQDMRNSHKGLLLVAQRDFKRHGLDVRDLPPRYLLVFFNEKGNRYKIMMPSKYTQDRKVYSWIVLYETEPVGRVSMEQILRLPQKVAGRGMFSIAPAGAELLQEELRMKRVRTVVPLLE
jgi:hypothetical protein